jgi:hypothetical protein
MYDNEKTCLAGSTQRQSSVQEQMDRLQSRVADIHGVTDRLSNRLHTAMRPSTPTNTAEQLKQTSDPCILSGKIREQVEFLDHAIVLLTDIIDRIEV